MWHDCADVYTLCSATAAHHLYDGDAPSRELSACSLQPGVMQCAIVAMSDVW